MKLTSLLGKYRWDSSDPDRAPPPLPLNPGGTSSPITKPNTSANVAAAAEAFAAKARESVYTTNPMPTKSPERSLIKGQYHKRMQSLQNSNGAIRDLSNYLENSRSPERSPERLSRFSFDYENRSPDRSPTRSGTPTPGARDLGKDMASLRPTGRPAPKAILGESTPQSATMLALQNTPTPKETDTSLSSITNGSTALVRTPHSFDAISSQILSLTSIATNLQREMAQLSRRSKDNATDLVSLKEATNARDEDIRKSLRDLVTNLSIPPMTEIGNRNTSQYMRSPGSYLLDNKPHGSPGSIGKSVSLPRIPSPTSFAASLEREIASSPSPFSVDGAASIALLEKILREMGTKEGQDRVLSSLTELASKSPGKNSDPAIFKRLEDIMKLLKDSTESRALVMRRDNGNQNEGKPPNLELDFDHPRSVPLAQNARDITSYGTSNPAAGIDNRQQYRSHRAADFVGEDMQKLLKRMKDSITESGGLTAETKTLVRELRGEVLGMGREIARKLDQAEASQKQADSSNYARGPGRDEIAKIVEDGLGQLKLHMDRVLQERRRQSSASAVSRSTVDSQEIYHAVKTALSEMPPQQQIAVQQPGSGIEREEILEAVREAWETYKPEIELQNFGLERDEILQCLKEGLQDHQNKTPTKAIEGASYDEVLEAVQEGLKHFTPPAPVETEATITREEILIAVRECLESFEFPASHVSRERESDITREDVLDAVKEGLSSQPPVAREIEFNRDDLFDAVKAGLEGVPTPMDGVGEQVLEKMQDLIDGMRGEFKQYSAANGRDTEQVLDAVKDGLEVLRAGIETYVDRAADVTGKDEIIETVKDGLEHLRIDLEGTIASSPQNSQNTNSGELLDAMEREFEHLRQTIATSLIRNGGSTSDKEEIMDAIRDGLDDIKTHTKQSSTTDLNSETVQVVKDEIEHLRETLAMTMTRSAPAIDREEILETLREGLDGIRTNIERDTGRPESILSNTSELLDAFNEGLDSLKLDIEKMVNKPLDMTVNYEILDTLKEGLLGVRADIDRLHAAQLEQESLSGKGGGTVVIADGEVKGLGRTDIENLEVMITQLRIKVEALDNMTPPTPQTQTEAVISKEDFERLEDALKETREAVSTLAERQRTQDDLTVTKDDTDAIETLLRNTKAKLDEMIFPEPEGMARTAHLDAVESILRGTRDAVDDLTTRQEAETASKTDVGILEALVKEVRAGLEDMREKVTGSDSGEKVSKTDIEALEALCLDTKTQLDELVIPVMETLPSKIDIDELGGLIKTFQGKVEAEADLTAQAFESRKIEHGGLFDKMEDVKGFLDQVRNELKLQLDGNSHSLEELANSLDRISAAFAASDASSSVKELADIINREFERSHGISEGARVEGEQHRDIVLEKHEDNKTAIIAELGSKLDSRFDELMIKYDDAQIATDARTTANSDKEGQQAETLSATRGIAEDLRILVETLGSTVTDSCDRIGEDSKTVFNRVEDIAAKMEDSTNSICAAGKTEHQITRGEISKTLVAVEGIQAHATEYHPKIMNAVTEVLNIVGQHYEQAQRSTEEIKSSVNAIPSAIPVPALTAPLSSPLLEAILPSDKYDDKEVHAKLDKLVEHAAEAGQSAAQFELLEQIKEQVAATANQLTNFMGVQEAANAERQDIRTREAEEASVALEKRIAQKRNVESDIVKLSEEKSVLSDSVMSLRNEERELTILKSRLQADLSSLETALQIRREEMQLMEARAEGLERRIIEGVLDHSRSLLITSRPQSSLKAMNLKRVTSTASNATTMTRTSIAPSNTVGSAISSGVEMALKRRPPQRSPVGSQSGTPKGDRRILSLSTIGGNKGHGNERSVILANPSLAGGGTAKGGASFGSGGLKRSHSVKSNFPARKTSWGGTKQIGMYAEELEEDKENSILNEEDEGEESDGGTERRTSYGTGTERRTSYTGTYTGTGSYGTGSVLDGDDDRSTSYAASTVGTLGVKDAEFHEGDDSVSDEGQSGQGEEGEPEPGAQDITLYQGDLVATKETNNPQELVMYGLPSDSGIGTDIPTAALEGGGEYFRNDD